MREELGAAGVEMQPRMRRASAALERHAPAYGELLEKIGRSRTYWPAGRPTEPLDARYPLPECPEEYTVIATDGSQIEPDRHRSVLCYVLNVGKVLLRYGPQARAILQSSPQLAFKDDDMYIMSNNRRFLTQGHILTVKRSILETEALADMVESSETVRPVVGLQDGTLIMQTLEGWGIEDELREEMTQKFLGCLERLRKLEVPLASYISRPRAADVVNALRIAECPHPVATCKQHCSNLGGVDSEPCAWLGGIPDRSLFEHLPLRDGERSGLFMSSSSISLQHYGEHKVYYFYLNVGREVARIEIPEWVACDATSLTHVHTVIYDQCRRGDGYPRSLAEAHEKAVIGGADYETFWRLVDAMLGSQGLMPRTSQKERSKRIRGL
jgi:hypothetical protein